MYYFPHMHPYHYQYQHTYFGNVPTYGYGMPPVYRPFPAADEMAMASRSAPWHSADDKEKIALKDYGGKPFVININEAARQNRTFRTAIWTGKHLQVTVMSLNPGEDIGLEVHPATDQFMRIEAGQGLVEMGDKKDNLYFKKKVHDDDAIMVPAGIWHNLTNTGHKPLKLYVIYAPPEHPFGTVHKTKAEAMAEEHQY